MIKYRKLILIIIILLTAALYPWRREGNYIVIEKGDTLRKMAHNIYGNENEFIKLWEYRVDKLKYTKKNILQIGMKFNIPPVMGINPVMPENLPYEKHIKEITSYLDSTNKILDTIDNTVGTKLDSIITMKKEETSFFSFSSIIKLIIDIIKASLVMLLVDIALKPIFKTERRERPRRRRFARGRRQ